MSCSVETEKPSGVRNESWSVGDSRDSRTGGVELSRDSWQEWAMKIRHPLNWVLFKLRSTFHLYLTNV